MGGEEQDIEGLLRGDRLPDSFRQGDRQGKVTSNEIVMVACSVQLFSYKLVL